MTLTVLAVDDSRTMRDLLRVALVPRGFDVHLATDGEDALEVLASIAPDVIITDINMPRLDGFGLIANLRAREHTRRTPIIVLTTESAPELRERARSAGATGWIVKPFDEAKLVAAVRRVAG